MMSEMRKYVKFSGLWNKEDILSLHGPSTRECIGALSHDTYLTSIIISRKEEAVLQQIIIEMRKKKHNNIISFDKTMTY